MIAGTARRPPTCAELPPPPPERHGWPWTEAPPPLPDHLPSGAPWPRITVVTPSYNQAAFLEETIRSVLLQGYPNLEYLVLDGGSSDGSRAILERYAPWLDYVVSQPDSGQADAINQGFRRASGAVLGWINSDDILLPEALRRLAEAHLQAPAALVLGDVINHDQQRDTHERVRQHNVTVAHMVTLWRHVGCWHQPGCYVPRAQYLRSGELDASLRYLFDADWMCRLLQHAPVTYVHAPVAQFRLHAASKTVAEAQAWLPEYAEIVRRYGQHVPGLKPRRVQAELALCGAYAHLDQQRYDRGHGQRYLRQALRHDRRILLTPRFVMALLAALGPRQLVLRSQRWLRQLGIRPSRW